jgi:hypothetical protein
MKTWGRSILPIFFLLALPASSMAQVDISVNIAPPELPVYDQPPIPGDGYVWTPGYWAWGDDIQDYYWVPGTWVPAPQPEYLWTPGYWAADGAVFFFHPGYWGPHVGFYGGVNYGYGYGGQGYEGGYWQGGRMYYNRSVTNVSNTNITNVYNKTVINNVSVTRVSYNGGSGGVRAQPSAADQRAEHDRHLPATSVQTQHIQAARGNPVLRASQNNGRPSIAATSRAGAFTGAGVVSASRGGIVHPNPQAHAVQPGNRPAQPENRSTPEQRRPAPRPPVEQPHPAVEQHQPAPRPPVEQPHPAVEQHQAAPRPPVEQPRPPVEHAPAEQRRATDQAPPPRPQPRAEPHPAEHPPAKEEDHERH